MLCMCMCTHDVVVSWETIVGCSLNVSQRRWQTSRWLSNVRQWNGVHTATLVWKRKRGRLTTHWQHRRTTPLLAGQLSSWSRTGQWRRRGQQVGSGAAGRHLMTRPHRLHNVPSPQSSLPPRLVSWYSSETQAWLPVKMLLHNNLIISLSWESVVCCWPPNSLELTEWWSAWSDA